MLRNLCKATDKYEAAIAMQPEAAQRNKDREINVRQQQYSHLCLEGIMNEYSGTTLILDRMEAQTNPEIMLLKEFALLTACTLCANDDELMMSTFANENINLDIPDPKSQSEIDRMHPRDAARFNNATITEVNGMKGKKSFRICNHGQLAAGDKNLPKYRQLDI